MQIIADIGGHLGTVGIRHFQKPRKQLNFGGGNAPRACSRGQIFLSVELLAFLRGLKVAVNDHDSAPKGAPQLLRIDSDLNAADRLPRIVCTCSSGGFAAADPDPGPGRRRSAGKIHASAANDRKQDPFQERPDGSCASGTQGGDRKRGGDQNDADPQQDRGKAAAGFSFARAAGSFFCPDTRLSHGVKKGYAAAQGLHHAGCSIPHAHARAVLIILQKQAVCFFFQYLLRIGRCGNRPEIGHDLLPVPVQIFNHFHRLPLFRACRYHAGSRPDTAAGVQCRLLCRDEQSGDRDHCPLQAE